MQPSVAVLEAVCKAVIKDGVWVFRVLLINLFVNMNLSLAQCKNSIRAPNDKDNNVVVQIFIWQNDFESLKFNDKPTKDRK